MSDYEKRMREYQRAKQRQEREELRVAREIGRARKEREKASELERAELDVAEFKAHLGMLLSLHREVGEQWNWQELAASLPPHPPAPVNHREIRARQDLEIASVEKQKQAEDILEAARRGDRLESEAAAKAFEEEKVGWQKMTALARRILVGDMAAYRDVLSEFSPFAEMEHLGSSMEFTMHAPSFLECVLTMKDTAAIPAETKTLTSTGKLSVKPMPRQQFHEIYQDYICGGVLRVARELFALLPVEDILVTVITAFTNLVGRTSDQPVLSVVVTRSALEELNFELLDPSDTIETMAYCGDFKATRKTGAFQPINPLKYEHVALPSAEGEGLEELLHRTATLRNEFKEQLSKMQEVAAQ